MEIKKVGGIYKIENRINGKVYIGQTSNLHKRKLEHFAALRRGNHCNKHLQFAFNKYGEENFKFEVIETCPPSDRDAREIYWIDTLNATNDKIGYNIADGGSSGGGKSSYRQVICLSTNCIYRSVSDAAKHHGVTTATITSACKMRYSRGMKSKLYRQSTFWMYYDEYTLLSDKDKSKILYNLLDSRLDALDEFSTKTSIPVVLLNTGVEYGSISEAAKEYNLDISTVSRCCKHKQHSAGEDPITNERLCWVFKDEYNSMSDGDINKLLYTAQNPPMHSMDTIRKKIVLLHPFTVFDSISQAAEAYGLTVTYICTCCKGKRDYAGFHPITKLKLHWMYYNEYLRNKPNNQNATA